MLQEMMKALEMNKEFYREVVSSAIEVISVNRYGGGYEQVQLAIGFTGDRWYSYIVPVEVAQGLVQTDSFGKYYNRNIKGKYESERM